MKSVIKIALGVVLGIMLLSVGCGVVIGLSDDGTDSATVKTTADEQGVAETTPANTGPEEDVATVGDSVFLRDQDGNQLRVVVLRVTTNVQAPEYEQPEGKYVGVEMLIANPNPGSVRDYPRNNIKVIDRDNRQHDPAITVDTSCDAPGEIRLAGGAKRRICVAFDIPKDAYIRSVQYTPSSGFADDTGEWIVPAAPAP